MKRIADYYGLSEGCIEALQEQTEMFARCMQAFCSQIPNLKTRQVMLKSFERRLRWRTKADVLQVIRIPGMSTALASHLVRVNNLRSPLALSHISVQKLARFLSDFLQKSKSFHTTMVPFLQHEDLASAQENLPQNDEQDVFQQLAIEIISRAEKVVEDDDTETVINDILLQRYRASRLQP